MPERYKPFRFSQAGLRGLKVSATLALNERVREMWDSGRNVYQLGFGESRFPVHPKIAATFAESSQRRSYLPTLGLWELRQKIAHFYRRKFELEVTPDQVIVGPGSKSLIYVLQLILGDEIILPQPSWVSYAPQARLLDKPITWVPTRPEDGYFPNVATLQEKIEEAEKNWGTPELLILNSPNNPTGTMLTVEQGQALADLAREQKLMILSDEIYALNAHGKIPHTSMARHYPEGTVVLGGLSKHLSLGGWRFGVAILPPGRTGEAICVALQTVAGSIWSCVAAPIQYAAMAAYDQDPDIDQFINTCTCIHGIRTRYLYDMVMELGVDCVAPAGGFYIFPSFQKWRKALASRGVNSDADLAMYLLEHYELATLPGSASNYPAEALCLRISSSYVDMDTDEKAAYLLEAFRKNPDGERLIHDYHPGLQAVASRLADFVTDLKR